MVPVSIGFIAKFTDFEIGKYILSIPGFEFRLVFTANFLGYLEHEYMRVSSQHFSCISSDLLLIVATYRFYRCGKAFYDGLVYAYAIADLVVKSCDIILKASLSILQI